MVGFEANLISKASRFRVLTLRATSFGGSESWES